MAGAAVVLAIALLVAWGPSRPASAQAPRPNIVVVMSDDQAAESMRFMPQVKARLADQGTTFANSFVGYSLCCPSRATYLTGQYSHNNGVMGNRPPGGGYAKLNHSNTLPVWLRAAGYRTAHIGKYLNGYGAQVPQTTVPPGYESWQGLVDPYTYRMYDYTINDNGVLRAYGTAPADYQTDVLAARAENLIKGWAPDPRPFFLTVAPLAPHGEARSPSYTGGGPRPAPRHAGRFASEPLPRPPSFNEADVSDKPKFIRDLPPMSVAAVNTVTTSYRKRAESLLAVDEMVARLVDALAASGELENTIFVYTSDNGFFHGEHRITAGKYHMYEPSLRVPLVVRGPGFARNKVVGAPVVNVDLATTFVAVAGATPRRALDGLPLQNAAKGGEADQRVILDENGPPASIASGWQRTIRGPGFSYTEHSTGERELYDLTKDPHQLGNLAGDPAHAARVAELSKRLASLAACSGASCHGLPSSPTTTGAPVPSGGADGFRQISLPKRALGRSGTSRLSVVVACADGSENGCFGTLKLTFLAKSRSTGKTVHVRAGTAKLRMQQDTTRRIRVKLGASGRSYLRRHRSVRVRATAKIVDSGGLPETARRTYRLRRR